MGTEPFRFMDLHPEIRDDIYELILCGFPGEESQRAVIPYRMNYPHYHKTGCSILLTNHQISREAVDVALRRGLFVRVIFQRVNPHRLMIPKRVPIVSEGASAFNGCVMSHWIEGSEDDYLPVRQMIIRARDLELFCQSLMAGGIRKFSTKSKHYVTIHNQFTTTSTPNYLSLNKQVSSALCIRRSTFHAEKFSQQ